MTWNDDKTLVQGLSSHSVESIHLYAFTVIFMGGMKIPEVYTMYRVHCEEYYGKRMIFTEQIQSSTVH